MFVDTFLVEGFSCRLSNTWQRAESIALGNQELLGRPARLLLWILKGLWGDGQGAMLS